MPKCLAFSGHSRVIPFFNQYNVQSGRQGCVCYWGGSGGMGKGGGWKPREGKTARPSGTSVSAGRQVPGRSVDPSAMAVVQVASSSNEG